MRLFLVMVILERDRCKRHVVNIVSSFVLRLRCLSQFIIKLRGCQSVYLCIEPKKVSPERK